MKKRTFLLPALLAFLTFLAFLTLAACGQEEDAEIPYLLYFQEGDLGFAAGGGALQTETLYLPQEETQDPQLLAEFLMERLLEGPFDETLKSTLPAGTSLVSLDLTGGLALVDLSGHYSNLSGVALTLADSAVTMTLTQIPEILSVRITVGGRELAYRDKQVFTARDILLTPEEDIISTVPAMLYFLNAEGSLTAEERTLDIYEGDTQVSAVARALERGPESRELLPVLPFQVRSLWQEEEICYVNLSSAQLEGMEDAALNTSLEALRESLCSLETVSETRFLVDGEFNRSANVGAS